MRIIIVGDGKMGSTFAQRLSKAGHDVTIIDKRATALQHTIESLDIMAIEGNGTTLEIQREAGVEQADLLIVGGTSLNVRPAAGLINYFRGDRLALINKSPVARDLAAGLVITDPIGEVLSQL